MATLKAPFALDRSLNTTELTPRNIADVLAEGFSHITGRTASEVEYDNTDSGLTADNVQDALDEIVEDIPTVPSVDIQTAVDEFETYNGGLLSSLKVSLSPNQDLHGYSEPWVGGARKNKLPLILADIKSLNTSGTWSGNVYTINGGTITVNTDDDGNVISIVGNETFTAQSNLQLCGSANLINGTSYDLNGCPSGGSNSTFRLSLYNNVMSAKSDTGSGVNFTYDSSGSNEQAYIRFYANYTANNVTFYPMIRLSTESDPTFEPYSNICPISGHTQVDVDVSDGDTTQEQVTVNLGGTYYSGTLDVVTGVLTVDKVGKDMTTITDWNVNIANQRIYKILSDIKPTSGSTIIPNIISNRFKAISINDIYAYVQGVAVSTGSALQFHIKGLTDRNDVTLAEVNQWFVDNPTLVVYELATPLTIQLSPTMVKALVGENHLSAPLEGQEITESKYKQIFTFDDVIAYIQSL